MNTATPPVPLNTPPAVAPQFKSVGTGAAPATVLRISSQDVFAGAQEVEVEHNGVVYRLRQTSLGKLILTK